MVGRFVIADAGVPPGRGAVNSAQRVAAVRRRHRLDAGPAQLAGQSVLLVDDRVVTGWTLTLAAAALREAGASAVAPLTLALES